MIFKKKSEWREYKKEKKKKKESRRKKLKNAQFKE